MLTVLHSRAPNLSFRKKYQRARRNLFFIYYQHLKMFISISSTVFDISKVDYGQLYFSCAVRNLDLFLVFDWSSKTTLLPIGSTDSKWILIMDALFISCSSYILLSVTFTLFVTYCLWEVTVCQPFFCITMLNLFFFKYLKILLFYLYFFNFNTIVKLMQFVKWCRPY